MKCNRNKLLHFYDDPRSSEYSSVGRGGHVSAITGLIGEDLLIAVLMHYWESEGFHDSKQLPDSCKQPGLQGKKLDAWLLRDPETIFQVEIKNWSAHSKGGETISANAPNEDILQKAIKRWNEYFEPGGDLPATASKVLIEMPRPKSYENLKHEKLLLFWFPISDSKQKPMSKTNTDQGCLHVFSASMYLRSFSDEVLELCMPRVEERFRILGSLMQYGDK